MMPYQHANVNQHAHVTTTHTAGRGVAHHRGRRRRRCGALLLSGFLALALAACGAPAAAPGPPAAPPEPAGVRATLAALPTVPPPTPRADRPPRTPPPTPVIRETVMATAPVPPTASPPADSPPADDASAAGFLHLPEQAGAAGGAPPVEGRLGEVITSGAVQVQALVSELPGVDPPRWIIDLAIHVRPSAGRTMPWSLPSASDAAAGRMRASDVRIALVTAPPTPTVLRLLAAHGDVGADPAASAVLRGTACTVPAAADASMGVIRAPWDTGVGPYPRRIPPGATVRSMLIAPDVGMPLRAAAAQDLRLGVIVPGQPPVLIRLADPLADPPLPPLPAPAQAGQAGADPAALPGGARVVDTATYPAPPGCPGGRQVTITLTNPTTRTLDIPSLIIALAGYRYPVPLPPDMALLPPGDQRTIPVLLAPIPASAAAAPATLLALAPQRADDTPTPWSAVPIAP